MTTPPPFPLLALAPSTVVARGGLGFELLPSSVGPAAPSTWQHGFALPELSILPTASGLVPRALAPTVALCSFARAPFPFLLSGRLSQPPTPTCAAGGNW